VPLTLKLRLIKTIATKHDIAVLYLIINKEWFCKTFAEKSKYHNDAKNIA
jgi:hypothetical protein